MAGILLLISQKAEDAEFAKEVATTAGLEFVHAPTSSSGIQTIVAAEPKIIMVDGSTQALYQQFENEVQESIGLFSDRINSNSIHWISSETLDKLPYLVQSPLFGHLILRKFDRPKEIGPFYGRVITATLKERAFGLDSLMKEGVKVQTLKLISSDQKQKAVDAIKNYILQAKFQSRMATLIANAIDEILMNAIFDAPTDSVGRQLYANTPRSTVVKLEGKSAVEIQIAFDGQYLGITAIDHFGSLDKAKILAHISKAYTEDEYKVKSSAAGAGIGLGTIYQTGGSFFFASESHQRTEVSIFFRRTDNYREFRDQFRFFSTQFYF